MYANYLEENQPDAKVALLTQNDDFGRAYVDTFNAAIEGTDIDGRGRGDLRVQQPRHELADHQPGSTAGPTPWCWAPPPWPARPH